MNLDSQPRFRLARLPTPLQEANRLREALGGRLECPRILLKRDDLSDLALGGNKARKLEFLVGDAKIKGATALITTGGVQSNHARMTAAAARIAGMKSALVLTSEDEKPDSQGNLLLDRVLGADVHFVSGTTTKGGTTSAEDQKVAEIISALEVAGETPYFVPLGGSNAIGTLGYVDGTRELQSQLDERGLRPARLYYASGSRGTQAGLELGSRIFNAAYKCIGIAVSGGEETKREHAVRIANEAATLIGAGVRVQPDDLMTDQDHYGEGYAIATHDCVEAIRLVAGTEGVLLDPVYSGKAMAGMLAHIRNGAISPGETIVFLHTGGVPGFFAQARSVLDLLGAT
jgi:D-cysteine desulfhydrase family pyridoxal phosphate-dependent enzyme